MGIHHNIVQVMAIGIVEWPAAGHQTERRIAGVPVYRLRRERGLARDLNAVDGKDNQMAVRSLDLHGVAFMQFLEPEKDARARV